MRRTALAPLLLLALAVAGCGSSDSSGNAGTPGQGAGTATTDPAGIGRLQIATDPSGQPKFSQTALSAKAGLVRIDLTNTSSVPHDLVIAQDGADLAKTSTVTNSTETLTIALQPGTYTFYCSVTGHRQAGMEGTLTVQ
jgi:plastocyanin